MEPFHLKSVTAEYYCDPDKAIDDIVSWMKKNTHELGDVLEEI